MHNLECEYKIRIVEQSKFNKYILNKIQYLNSSSGFR